MEMVRNAVNSFLRSLGVTEFFHIVVTSSAYMVSYITALLYRSPSRTAVFRPAALTLFLGNDAARNAITLALTPAGRENVCDGMRPMARRPAAPLCLGSLRRRLKSAVAQRSGRINQHSRSVEGSRGTFHAIPVEQPIQLHAGRGPRWPSGRHLAARRTISVNR